jgi:hypothetical protein
MAPVLVFRALGYAVLGFLSVVFLAVSLISAGKSIVPVKD